jgi:U4/U6.U5 tri-snRNP component SNU23
MKIAELRASTAASAESKQYNFDLRIKEIKQMEMDTRTANKEAKKKKKLDSKKVEEKVLVGEDIEMNAMMGFAQFG